MNLEPMSQRNSVIGVCARRNIEFGKKYKIKMHVRKRVKKWLKLRKKTFPLPKEKYVGAGHVSFRLLLDIVFLSKANRESYFVAVKESEAPILIVIRICRYIILEV